MHAFQGNSSPTFKHAFSFLVLFSKTCFAQSHVYKYCESRRRPALRFTDMPAYMPYLYKLIFNQQIYKC